ncbi:hypothetical protein TRFO_33591 [Tritrichomonas foetus]|uniref:Uncharacterized protein n=1 Tax=Tritrichomonas foetus TaxID=1144522 RepID=A0A1J4JRG9_9EUKA|nr:hypothetical protein TRFO_33591 [Tritrichomonas foetus]|eukprot:OHS99844.1 hypothetical protein TRFO_33591 [Tritrichomonas foetus]
MENRIERSVRRDITNKLIRALAMFIPGRSDESLLTILSNLNLWMADENEKDEVLAKLNAQIFNTPGKDIPKLLIDLFPFFNNLILNEIAVLFVTTLEKFPEDSLPSYIMNHRELVGTLYSYIEKPYLSNTSQTIFRHCIINSETFTRFVYTKGFFSSFIEFLTGDNLEQLITAFATYDAILNSHPDISADYCTRNWSFVQLQFKQIMTSPNYPVQLTFLPILVKFLTLEPCLYCLYCYLEDLENLKFVFYLLDGSSKKVQTQAYNLLKLFVVNPKKTKTIKETIASNKKKLARIIRKVQMDDDAPEFEEERQEVIMLIENM